MSALIIREFVPADFDRFAEACAWEDGAMPICREFVDAKLFVVADANGVFAVDARGELWSMIGTVFTKRLAAEYFLAGLPGNLCLEHPTEPTDLRCFGFVCV